MQFIDFLKSLREQNKKQYELYNVHTGDVVDTFDTRSEASAEKVGYDLSGNWAYRIRTIRTEA
jgi:hypothetical protein